jgi:transposase InsO family protein
MGDQRGRRVDPDLKQEIIELVENATNAGCRKKIACNDLGIDFKTLNRWKEGIMDKRQGPLSEPVNKLSDVEKDQIVETANSKRFADLSPWQIVATLADEKRYIASESTFYKVLKERKLLAHRGKSKAPTQKRPAPLIATAPNQIWSWDITYLKSGIKGQYFYLYLFMDIFSRKIVGYDIFECESMDYSADLFNKICLNENIEKDQLILHSDNGGPMKGATMLATMQRLGVVPSFSRPRVSDDNPYSESLFKTLKYRSNFEEVFSELGDAKKWVMKFVDWYNNCHLHSGIKFVTPESKHRGDDVIILERRKQVYEEAKNKHPERWGKRATRNWEEIKKVSLNYLQTKKSDAILRAS